MLQLIFKIILIGIAVVIVAVVIDWVVRQDIDVKKTLDPKRVIDKVSDKVKEMVNTPKALLVVREPTMLYFKGNPCGYTVTESIDEKSGIITFKEITKADISLLGSEMEFRQLIIKIDHVDVSSTHTFGRESDGVIWTGASGHIIGKRTD